MFLRWVFGGGSEYDHPPGRPERPSTSSRRKEWRAETSQERELGDESADKILIVSLKRPDLDTLVVGGRDEKEHLLDERVIERDVVWGDCVTVGPITAESYIVVTLGDGSVVDIPFPPEDTSGLVYQGEGSYAVYGRTQQQLLVKWSSSEIPLRLGHATRCFERRGTWLLVTGIVLPILYFCLCLYSLYKLGVFGEDTVNELGPTPSEFSYLVLPMTLLIGMWIALRALWTGVKTRIRTWAPFIEFISWCRRRRQHTKKDSLTLSDLLWHIEFLELSREEDRAVVEVTFHEADNKHISAEHRRQAAAAAEASGFGVGLGDPEGKHHPETELTTRLHMSAPELSKAGKGIPQATGVGGTERGVEALPNCELSEWGSQIHPTCWGAWSVPDTSTIKVRGKTYMTDRVKIPAGDRWLFWNCQTDLLANKEIIFHMCARPDSWLQRMVAAKKHDPSRLTICVNFVMTGWNFVCYFVRSDERSEEAEWLIQKFLDGSNEYRDSTLKFIPRITEGPWVVKRAVGTTPAIIGKKLAQSYYRDEALNYLEIDIDVNSSVVGKNLLGIVNSYCTSLIVDFAFLLQGESEDELPERLLGGCRVIHGDFSKCYVLPYMGLGLQSSTTPASASSSSPTLVRAFSSPEVSR